MAMGDLLARARDAVMVDAEEPDESDTPEAAGDELPADPAPSRRGKAGRTSNAGRGSQPANRVTAAQRRAVHDALDMLITIPAAGLALRDPLCGGAVLDNVADVVDRLTPIVCRNPNMLAFFTESTGYLEWLMLAKAVGPIVKVMWSHHVTHTIGHGEGDDDASAAPVDISAYHAPVFAAA